jgi:hypothetical protein
MQLRVSENAPGELNEEQQSTVPYPAEQKASG